MGHRKWLVQFQNKFLFEKCFFFLVNGQIKQWIYFSNTIQNSSIHFISNYLDIVCALINAYGSRPVSDIHSGSEMAYRMLQAFNELNDIQIHLSKIAMERSEWKKYDAQMCLFPELDEQDLGNLYFGMKA